jgi:hypothetical protein
VRSLLGLLLRLMLPLLPLLLIIIEPIISFPWGLQIIVISNQGCVLQRVELPGSGVMLRLLHVIPVMCRHRHAIRQWESSPLTWSGFARELSILLGTCLLNVCQVS